MLGLLCFISGDILLTFKPDRLILGYVSEESTNFRVQTKLLKVAFNACTLLLSDVCTPFP